MQKSYLGCSDPDFLDKQQEADLATFLARRTYDSSLGVPFERYVLSRRRGAALDYIRDQRLMERNAYRSASSDVYTIAQLGHQLGHRPNSEEISRFLSREPKQFVSYLPLTGDFADSNHSLTLTGRIDPIRDYLKGFSKVERIIFLLKYVDGLTNQRIGESFGWHGTYIGQVVATCLRRLREKLV